MSTHDYKTRWHAVIVGIGSRKGKGPTQVGRTDGDCMPPCLGDYGRGIPPIGVIIIRLLYKVNPSERILDVTLLKLSDEVVESE